VIKVREDDFEVIHSENTITMEPIDINQHTNNNLVPKPKKKRLKKVLLIIGSFFAFGIMSGLFLLYGPWSYFRELWITSAMSTMNHKYLASWFYDDRTIEEVMNDNRVIESGEDSNSNEITVGKKNINGTIRYESVYEEQILKRDKDNALYKIIDIKGLKYNGYLVVIYDPSKIKMGISKYFGVKGQNITDIAKNYNSRITINGGGYEDPELQGNGGTPIGSIVKDGKIIWRSRQKALNGGIIGFNKNNILVLTRQTIDEAVKNGMRDSVEFGPFLIVNGKASFIRGNGGAGLAPRTIIGQRQDGITLFLIIDGRQISSVGADMVDVTEIMQRYKAYNAANLDGGASTALVVDGILRNKPVAHTKTGERLIPNAFIVVDK
jgi:exopolysaccharide biosynthesis protein